MLLGAIGPTLLGCSEPTQKTGGFADQAEVTVYVAETIITMEPDLPRASAVGVEGDRIVAVGSLDEVLARLEGRSTKVVRTFEDKTLLPGLIEPHLHPYIAGILLPMAFVTPHDWDLPGREIKGVRGKEAYLARLTELEARLGQPSAGEPEWFWSWGFHHYFHGTLSRSDLDAISATRPILVWHRSFHEIYANSAALSELEITAEIIGDHPQVDFENGHFFENGLQILVPRIVPILLEPERYGKALEEAREIIHAGGITTIADGAFGSLDFEQELQSLVAAGYDSDVTPFRSILLVDGKVSGERIGHEATRDLILSLPERNTNRLRFPEKQVKLFADGAAYSQLMQMRDGYLDGHHGEWMMQPELLEEATRVYWEAGFQVHVHVNGDLGLEKTLDILETLQSETPRTGHRFALHHLAYSGPDQTRRIAELGAMVSANPYYLWALGDKYAEVGLGPERAHSLVRSGSLVKAGVPLAFHSDFTMAPAQPLLLAWAAATRLTADGSVLDPDERISLDEALEAITIDAAFQLQLEHEVGSIAVGKKADFTILEQDPYEVPIESLEDIPIWGTVFEGTIYPLDP